VIRVYTASKAHHYLWWRALRAAGVPIAASWIDWPLNAPDTELPTAEQWRRHWQRCCLEAAAADVCLFVDMPGENQCGSLIELGCALASGRQVFLVSDNWWSVQNHPRCRVFSTLEAAIEAIRGDASG
jgi:hypothetical protein